MESTDYEKSAAPESGKQAPRPPPPPPAGGADCFAIDVALRVLLFASTLVAVVVMATAKQTELVSVPDVAFRVPLQAKFNQSPAFIYFVVALSVACLYSIITLLASFLKPVVPKVLLAHFALIDVLMLGLVASAIGAAGGVAYIGLRGNSHVGWLKVCNVYDKFCQHVGGAFGVSLVAAILLVFLVMLSIFSLSRRVRT